MIRKRKTSISRAWLRAMICLSIGSSLGACGGGGGGASNPGGNPPGTPPVSQPPPRTPTPAPIASSYPVRVGEVGMIDDSNPRKQPFACQTFVTVLGQPQVDNQAGIGYPVTDPGGNAPANHAAINPASVIGHSANCGAPMTVKYFYFSSTSQSLEDLPDPLARPADLARISVNDAMVNYIVRQEIGTLNRFVYSIFLLTPNPTAGSATDLSAWNGDLVFHFGGSDSVGATQSGSVAMALVARPDIVDFHLPLLQRGYALATSTGTATSTTEDILLSGNTANMVKQQFAAAYGMPEHTFGIGGSGGAIQQQLYEQNMPDLLDALIPIETFGDTFTELNPVSDCELLEFYFDRTDALVNGVGTVNPKWQDWNKRRMIEGYNARNGSPTRFDDGTGRPRGSSANPGSSECIEAWRGSIPLFVNPLHIEGDSYTLLQQTQPQAFAQTRFSIFDDLSHVFGTDPASGFAYHTFDNVGVQYGLQALRDAEITVDEFLLLNAHIGGWKNPRDFVAEGRPFDSRALTSDWDPWSSRNATARDHMIVGNIAPRSQANRDAIRAAYKYGLIFLGDIDAPTILIDLYKEPQLDEHHSRESFEVRERVIETKGNTDNLSIWTTEADLEELAPLLLRALDSQKLWLESGAKPTDAQDACFSANGALIYGGADAYDGVRTADTSDDGTCLLQFQIYGSPRSVAGEPLTGNVFQCHLKSVDDALNDDTYGMVDFTPTQVQRLRDIFPTGVCDYSLGDAGKPAL